MPTRANAPRPPNVRRLPEPVLLVDDPRFEPRLLARLFPLAWSAVSGAPARTRPDRPISFTPSRTEPIARPPWATRPPARKPSATTRLAQLGVWALIALGWLVFASWWVIVLRRERMDALAYAVGVLVVMLVTAVVTMALWTRYNIRLARRGKRGHSSRYIPMCWEYDTLQRPLALPPAARSAAEVRVVLRDGVKAYVVAEGGQR